MRVILILLGLLLMIGGGAVAGAQYAPPDLLKLLDSAPQQARDFLQTPTALYAGGGTAGFGFLLVIIAAMSGGKKNKAEKARPEKVKLEKAKPAKATAKTPEASAPPAKAPEPKAAAPAPQAAPEPTPAPVSPAPALAPAPKPAPAPQPAMAAAAPTPPAPPPEAPKPKPQASAQPPAGATEAGGKASIADVARTSPLLFNRRRVSDLVTINDALKAYFKKHNAYPVAAGLGGLAERGAAWIPGLAPEFVPELPRDPAMEAGGPQYVYASDGKDYKLLAHNVSLVGSTSVEVLGVRIDHTRKPTMENASFGYWTPGFAEA